MTIDVDRPLPFDELLLLTNGGVVVAGTLRIAAEGQTAERLRTPKDAVLVANFAGQRSATLTLMPPLTKQSDGWHDWRPPILAIGMERLVSALEHVRSHRAEPVRFSALISQGGVLSVQQRDPADQPGSYPTVYGHVSSIEGIAMPCSSGLRLQMAGPVSPTVADKPVPTLAGARLECDALIPWTYLRSVGSPLGYLAMSKFRPSTGPWKPAASGPRALALDGEQAFLKGHLSLAGQKTDLYPDGPFLRARVTQTETTLQGVRELTANADGFVYGNSNSGPQLVLQLGYEDFGRMLEQQRSAVLDLRGAGMGHVDGQTGWVMESGGPCTQDMIGCRIALERSDSGIRVDLSGELAPLAKGHWSKSLGPMFAAEFFVPKDYLLLRQWPVANLIQEWRKRHGVDFG